MIALRNVSAGYGREKDTVRGLNLTVPTGQFFALLGPSGCGKSTTLRLVNGMVAARSGTVTTAGLELGGEADLYALRRRIGYVLQDFGLFPHYSVRRNLAVVPELLGWEPRRIQERVQELLELVGLDAERYGDAYPDELSGGQQQRVALGRALAAAPQLMLLDEPFGALDPITKERLQGEYQLLHRRLGLTSLLVTHDVTEALLLADRIGVMAEGKLIQVGTPALLMTEPATREVELLMETPRRRWEQLRQVLSP